MPKKIEAAKLGHCPGCDAQIVDLSIQGRGKELDNYRQTFFELSDGSIMKVAMCEKCISKLDQKSGEQIMERFRINWRDEVESSEIIAEERKDDVIEEHLAKKLVSVKVRPRSVMLRTRKADTIKKQIHRQNNAELEAVNKEISAKREEEERLAKEKHDQDMEKIKEEENRLREQAESNRRAFELENQRNELETAKRSIE